LNSTKSVETTFDFGIEVKFDTFDFVEFVKVEHVEFDFNASVDELS